MAITAHRGEILDFLDDPSLTEGESIRHYKDGLLLVEDGKIAGIFDSDKADEFSKSGIQVIEHSNGLITPGFIDTHVHYPQCEVIAAYGTQLLEWLEKHTFPVESKFHDPAYADAISKFFLDELIRNGTTTALVFGTVHAESVESFFREAYARNLRMICGKVMMDRNAPPSVCDTPQSAYSDSENLIKDWHNQGRLGYAVTPRFAPTSSDEQLALAGKLLQLYPGVHLHTHMSENTEECKWVAELFPDARDYLDVYDQYGLLGRRSMFAHCIHLNEREWKRLAKTESNISHCPTSNLFIGSGLFDYQSALKHRVRVGLGTDVGGGDSFSLLRTINEAYKIQQLNGFNLSPYQSMYMATLGGARALDLDGFIGNFEEGKEADFVVLDYAATPLIDLRIRGTDDLLEKLFILEMLGDDRAVRETWIMGRKAN